jgi:hypothetical protein
MDQPSLSNFDPRSTVSDMAQRWAVVAAVSLGLVGGLVGLVVGLRVYPPTAWFAVIEVGVPAALVGGLIGFASGALVSAISRD